VGGAHAVAWTRDVASEALPPARAAGRTPTGAAAPRTGGEQGGAWGGGGLPGEPLLRQEPALVQDQMVDLARRELHRLRSVCSAPSSVATARSAVSRCLRRPEFTGTRKNKKSKKETSNSEPLSTHKEGGSNIFLGDAAAD